MEKPGRAIFSGVGESTGPLISGAARRVPVFPFFLAILEGPASSGRGRFHLGSVCSAGSDSAPRSPRGSESLLHLAMKRLTEESDSPGFLKPSPKEAVRASV